MVALGVLKTPPISQIPGIQRRRRDISSENGPSRHANRKPVGFILSVSLVSSPSSQRTELIHITSEPLIARPVIDHSAHATFRRYRMVNYDPLGVATPNEPFPPKIWTSSQRFTSFESGAPIVKYCLVFSMSSPMLAKGFILLDAGMVVPSLWFCDRSG